MKVLRVDLEVLTSVFVSVLLGCAGKGNDVAGRDATPSDTVGVEAPNEVGADEAAPVAADVPPSVSIELEAWIVSNPWNSWTCEAAPREARLNSPHQTVRVCQNSVLVAATAAGGTGAYPIGSASVKEMYYQGAIWAVTIAVRGKDGVGGDKWFWWRKVLDGTEAPPVTHASYGDAFCSGCHAGAAATSGRDFVFTLLP